MLNPQISNLINPLLKQADNPFSLKMLFMCHATFTKAFYFSAIFFLKVLAFYSLLFFLKQKLQKNENYYLFIFIFHRLSSSLTSLANNIIIFLKSNKKHNEEHLCFFVSVSVIRNTEPSLWSKDTSEEKVSSIFSELSWV